MRVPFCDLTRLSREVASATIDDWAECVCHADFVGGERVSKLEHKLMAKTLANHVVACANGTDALVLGLLALEVGPGDVVALPNLTFWATYEAVLSVGATPLLIDVDAELQLDLDELRKAHDLHRFNAAIFVHLFGWTSTRLAELRAFCRERDIKLLEDGAQAFGVELDGSSVLGGADVATLSLYPAKVIGGAGDGGAVLCKAPEHAELIRSLANHGRSSGYRHPYAGMNSRMGALQAAYLSHVLDLSDRILATRRSAVSTYARYLHGEQGLKVWGPPQGVQGNGYLSVMTSTRKTGDELAMALHEAGIGYARTYPTTVVDQPGAMGAMAYGDLPVSRAFCQRVVNLPVFFGLTPEELEAAGTALLNAA